MRKVSIDPSVLDVPYPVEIAIGLFAPEADPEGILFCYPGGGCNRHYFDLPVSGDISYSFARSMAEAGYLVVTVDHLGIGDSTRPEDGFDVTIERIIAANACVVDQICAEYPQVKKVIGVGHSMGAMLTVQQQDRHASFTALALLGFSNCGLGGELLAYGKWLAGQSDRAWHHGVKLAEERFGSGYSDVNVSPGRADSAVEPRAAESLKRGRGTLLTIPGSFSMLPECAGRETADLTVPVYLAIGERDICGPLDATASEFKSAAGQVFSVSLPDTGHMHFVYPSRHLLLERCQEWLRDL